MAKQFTLGRSERLKSRKQIDQLFKEGKAFNLFPFRVYYSAKLNPVFPEVSSGSKKEEKPFTIHYSPFTLHFGVGVSTRNFKKAVHRNRIKRLTREAWRLQKNELQDSLNKKNAALTVFFIYTAKELPEYNFVYEKATAVIKKLVKIIHENNSVAS